MFAFGNRQLSGRKKKKQKWLFSNEEAYEYAWDMCLWFDVAFNDISKKRENKKKTKRCLSFPLQLTSVQLEKQQRAKQKKKIEHTRIGANEITKWLGLKDVYQTTNRYQKKKEKLNVWKTQRRIVFRSINLLNFGNKWKELQQYLSVDGEKKYKYFHTFSKVFHGRSFQSMNLINFCFFCSHFVKWFLRLLYHFTNRIFYLYPVWFLNDYSVYVKIIYWYLYRIFKVLSILFFHFH